MMTRKQVNKVITLAVVVLVLTPAVLKVADLLTTFNEMVS